MNGSQREGSDNLAGFGEKHMPVANNARNQNMLDLGNPYKENVTFSKL